jgi:hypothetical protein
MGWCVAAGAVLGGVFGVLSNSFTGPQWALHRHWRTALAGIILAGLAFWVLPLLLGLIGLVGVAIEVPNFLTGMVSCFFAVWLVNRLVEAFQSPLPEAIAAGLLASIPFCPGTGGHFERPVWFADPIIARGLDPAFLLALSGVGIIFILFCILVLLRTADTSQSPRSRNTVGMLLLILFSGGVLFLLAWRIPPVPSSPVAPPKPPLSFSGNPPPPPPPEPEPVAAVQFSDIILPSPRLHGFYFRHPDPECTTNVMPTGDHVITMTVWYLKDSKAPLVLPGPTLEMTIPPTSDRAKQESWSATKLSWRNHGGKDDFLIHDDDDAETLMESAGSVPLATNTCRLLSPQKAEILRSLEEAKSGKLPISQKGLLKTLTASGVPSLPPAGSALGAAILVDWLSDHTTLDDMATNSPTNVQEFFDAGLKGSGQILAELAVELLQAQGYQARLARGYFVPGGNEPDDRFLITDAAAASWPEVRTATGFWIPLPVHPHKVQSHSESPPPVDQAKEIFDALAKNRTPVLTSLRPQDAHRGFVPILSIRSSSLFIGVLVLIIFSGSILGVLLDLRSINAASAQTRASVLLARLYRHAEPAYGPRCFGESWINYAEMGIRPFNPRRADLFLEVARMTEQNRIWSPTLLVICRILLAFWFWGRVPKFLQFLHRQPSLPLTH